MPPRRLASSPALVALALDNNMVYAFFVLVYSLISSARRDFSLIVGYFPGELHSRHQGMIRKILDDWSVSYELRELTPSPLFTERRHLTMTTFSKFVIADELAQPHLWLDIDTIARAGWDEIFEAITGAASGVSLVVAEAIASPHTRFDGFNAGVLGWTSEPRIPWRAALAELPEKRFSSEQFLFNTLYSGRVSRVRPRFNFLSSWHSHTEALSRSTIIHYSGPIKPWHLNRRHRSEWRAINPSWEYWYQAEANLNEKSNKSAYRQELHTMAKSALFSGRLHLGKGFLASYLMKFLAIAGPAGDPIVSLIAKRAKK